MEYRTIIIKSTYNAKIDKTEIEIESENDYIKIQCNDSEMLQLIKHFANGNGTLLQIRTEK